MKDLLKIFSVVLLMLLLAGCNNLSATKIEYKKITSQEAQAMMIDDVIIVDVRTQEEFDEGHIENAILIPDYEIKERASIELPDKNALILIYCRSGQRSENVARELIDMGYTNVYDFGGIIDWTGEIVGNINYMIFQRVHGQMPELKFNIIGKRERTYYGTDNEYSSIANNIEKIIVKDHNGELIQEIVGLHTENYASAEDIYGLSFEDWNFDGYLDIMLTIQRNSRGMGTRYFWLWDSAKSKFVENEELEEMSNGLYLSLDKENNQIYTWRKYVSSYYNHENGKYVLVKRDTDKYNEVQDNKQVTRHTIEELINGKWIVTQDYYEDS